ncbi:putative TIM-barrel fold metal-dependent hydrolase [Kribbella aluminosa]|uniref:TIM-barrel fold metal-dependent hydrolase n=1 Tax=Kribbella aluminosa TaxID=416017 RepID=A0ABS4UTW7_9ACTN|nr:amidohydrolase family protein [Kribbella aluminosa]MBP2354999.1 putative TIM-barrel fold metal-dependent hydrolase [Kribbella aluminosa]
MHFFEGSYSDRQQAAHPEGEVAHYAELRGQHELADALVIGYEGIPRFKGNNEFIRALSTTNAWMHPVAYIAPGTTASSIAELRAKGFVGASAYVDAQQVEDPDWFGWMTQTLAVLDEQQLLLSINAGPATHRALYGVLSRRPDLVFMMSHLGLPGVQPDPLDKSLAATKDLLMLANCHTKLSGAYATVAPGRAHDLAAAACDWIHWLVDSVGPERLLWGSDYSPVLEFLPFQQAVDVPGLQSLDDSQLRLVFRDNLDQLLAHVRAGIS